MCKASDCLDADRFGLFSTARLTRSIFSDVLTARLPPLKFDATFPLLSKSLTHLITVCLVHGRIITGLNKRAESVKQGFRINAI